MEKREIATELYLFNKLTTAEIAIKFGLTDISICRLIKEQLIKSYKIVYLNNFIFEHKGIIKIQFDIESPRRKRGVYIYEVIKEKDFPFWCETYNKYKLKCS